MLKPTRSLLVPLAILSNIFMISTSWSIPSNLTSFEQYKVECIKEVNHRGIAGSDGEKLCNCTLGKFKSIYNEKQFRSLLEMAQNPENKKAIGALNSVGEACYDKILYDS